MSTSTEIEYWCRLQRNSNTGFFREKYSSELPNWKEDADRRSRLVFSFTKPNVNTHKVHGWRSTSFFSGTVFFIPHFLLSLLFFPDIDSRTCKILFANQIFNLGNTFKALQVSPGDTFSDLTSSSPLVGSGSWSAAPLVIYDRLYFKTTDHK
jgi:hypothetical protein